MRKLGALLIALQVAILVAYGLFVKYEENTNGEQLHNTYAYFQDVHLMIFIGFGYLMTFLRRYGYGAVGFNMLLAAIAIELSILAQRLLESHGQSFALHFSHIMEGDIAAAAILISFGAVLGRLDPLQLVIMTVIEVIVFAVNFHIGMHMFGALDAGGSIFIHTFGAYFGLAVSLVNYEKFAASHPKNAPVYQSDLFAMIGTVFLWIAWPSFNAGLVADASGQYRAIVNTYFSLIACTVTAFAVSSLLDKRARIDMVHIQNSTLAGGVAVGACGNFMLQPYGALALGAIAGVVSVVGYKYITPTMARFRLLDTCGVHNLHGMPGVISAIASIVTIAVAKVETYGAAHFRDTFPEVHKGGDSFTVTNQALMQLAALGVTLAMAICGGLLTGLLIRWRWCNALNEETAFEDGKWWHLPAEVVTVHMHDHGEHEPGEHMVMIQKSV